jgi:hypothetical protein
MPEKSRRIEAGTQKKTDESLTGNGSFVNRPQLTQSGCPIPERSMALAIEPPESMLRRLEKRRNPVPTPTRDAVNSVQMGGTDEVRPMETKFRGFLDTKRGAITLQE